MKNLTLTLLTCLCILFAKSDLHAAKLALDSYQSQGAAQAESVTLRSTARQTFNLAGWTLSNLSGVVYTFPRLSLKKRKAHSRLAGVFRS